jgi:hypothetical protein
MTTRPGEIGLEKAKSDYEILVNMAYESTTVLRDG